MVLFDCSVLFWSGWNNGFVCLKFEKLNNNHSTLTCRGGFFIYAASYSNWDLLLFVYRTAIIVIETASFLLINSELFGSIAYSNWISCEKQEVEVIFWPAWSLLRCNSTKYHLRCHKLALCHHMYSASSFRPRFSRTILPHVIHSLHCHSFRFTFYLQI